MAFSLAKKNTSWDIDSLSSYISEVIGKESGNILGREQQSMVVSRLKKRFIELGNISPSDYYSYLVDSEKKEVDHLVGLLTTHHTFFFREFSHFEYLSENIESIVKNARSRGSKKLRVLSAACSRGQEVYSLAMLFKVHLASYPDMSFEIVGTDIDNDSVAFAKRGIYTYKEVKSIPQTYLTGHWQRGTGDISKYAKVKKELKSFCRFGAMNLLKFDRSLLNGKFDIIFCRNVFIYFEANLIKKICCDLKNSLYPGGLLITGLSESLKTLDFDKTALAPSVYSFETKKELPANSSALKIKKNLNVVVSKKQSINYPIKILVVDDSSSIVKLLSRIFKSDPQFELVGTAKDGIEAESFLKSNKVDAMTLDIHMPKMNGVEYLKKNFNSSHPKVIIISSISREDKQYTQDVIKYGASDFVEKPTLDNMKECSEEIRNKLKMSLLIKGSSENKIENNLHESITHLDKKGRVLLGSFGDLEKMSSIVKDLKGEQPPLYLFFEGNSSFLEIINEKLKEDGIRDGEVYSPSSVVLKNKIFICDFNKYFDEVLQKINKMQVSYGVLGLASNSFIEKMKGVGTFQLMVEDIEELGPEIRDIATELCSWTKFSINGTKYLAKDK